jgi:alanyl-tRNA synthetase
LTNRLYYTDAFLREFDAIVIDVIDIDQRRAAVLDRTAFYPTSGGQPFDTGLLGDVRVIDVVDRDDGVILHVIDGAIAPGAIHGCIDWDRRFEHMQQHTGQHVLSAAFERVCHARTESFHLGAQSSTIDLARELSPSEIAAAELDANRTVWDDRPVIIRFADEDEAARLALRKEPKRGGVLRLVEIEGVDLSACGGTHVSRTGAIGNIAVGSSERFRGRSRIEFRCGIRALHGCRALRESLSAASRLLSTGQDDVPAAIERVQAESKLARNRIKDQQDQLAHHEAAALSARGSRIDGFVHVVARVDDWDMAGLKSIATAIAARPGHVAVLVGTGTPQSIVAARAPDVTVDAAAIVRSVTATFGGKGGGRPALAQGGGLIADPDDVLRFVTDELNQQLKR